MKSRVWMLGVALIVLAAVMLLATGLDEMRLGPGRPLGLERSAGKGFALPSLNFMDDDTPVWKILLLWLAFVVNLALFFLLLPPELRRRTLNQLISFAIGVLALLLALRYRLLKLPEMPGEAAEQGGAASPSTATGVQALPPPQVAPWITYVASLIVLWVLLWVLYSAYRSWRRYRTRRSLVLGDIAQIARMSLAQLAAGRQWTDVVTQAYARMTDTVRARRGIQREPWSTPREFAARLVHTGLPVSSVDELTRLFESVRYGGRLSDDMAARRAAACLDSILRACGEGS